VAANLIIYLFLSQVPESRDFEKRRGTRARSIDAVLGHLSYPIFLVQWLGGVVGYLLLSTNITRAWELVLASGPVILVLAARSLGSTRVLSNHFAGDPAMRNGP